MVVHFQQFFLILSNHPVSGHKVASAPFLSARDTPPGPGGAIGGSKLRTLAETLVQPDSFSTWDRKAVNQSKLFRMTFDERVDLFRMWCL